jgi:hypothetical protein
LAGQKIVFEPSVLVAQLLKPIVSESYAPHYAPEGT